MFQRFRFVTGAAARLGCGLLTAMLGTLNFACADSFTLLNSFEGSGAGDGAYPSGELLLDPAGNLYGTTVSGGTECVVYGGCGTVFKLATDSTETILHSFDGTDGDVPIGNLVMAR